MEPILIRKDDHLIKKAKENIAFAITEGQEVYDLFKELGIEITVQDIHDFLHANYSTTKAAGHGTSTFIHNFITDKMVEKAGLPDFNGVPLKRESVKNLLQIPDSAHIHERIKELSNNWDHARNLRSLKVPHLDIKDGKVVAADDVMQKIEDEHTHYTKTERGAAVYLKLKEFADKAKELSDFLGKNAFGAPYLDLNSFDIPGMSIIDKPLPAEKIYYQKSHDGGLGRVVTEYVRHSVKLDFIRSQEQKAADNTLK